MLIFLSSVFQATTAGANFDAIPLNTIGALIDMTDANRPGLLAAWVLQSARFTASAACSTAAEPPHCAFLAA